MNYQVTCVCGNRFFVEADKVGRHVPCPVCNRALIPLTAQPDTGQPGIDGTPAGAAPGTTQASPDATKRCPFCGEVILAVARKCRFCNEFLDRTPVQVSAADLASQAAAASSGPPPSSPLPGSSTTDPTLPPPPVFALSVSQWDNSFRFILCAAAVVVAGFILFGIKPLYNLLTPSIAGLIFIGILAATGAMAYFYFLATRSARCTIRATRIETETGIFSKKVDSLEMFRIIDVELKQNLVERILGIGTVLIKSSDATSPELELYQIPQARKVQRFLLDQIPKADKERGTVRVQR